MTSLRETPPLTIDPGRQFGRVCINGTRVPAESVAWCVWADGGVDEAADAYEVSRNETLLACWWLVSEGYLNTVPGQRKRKAQWTAWSEHALRLLGGWEKRKRKLCDPDDFPVPPQESNET